MARGRTPTPAAPVDAGVTMDNEALSSANRALTVMSEEALALQRQFGLEDITPGTLVREIKVWIDHSARAMYEVGIRLCALRAICPQGEWIPTLQNQIGLEPRTAQRFMQAAVKCTSAAGAREQLLQLSRTKVIELVALDDDKLEELDKTGRISQLALELDEIDRMSVTELRQRLREVEQTVEAKQRRISKHVDEIEKLKERLEHPFTPTEDSEARTAEEQVLLDELRDQVTAAEAALQIIVQVLERGAKTRNEAFKSAVNTSLVYLAQRTAEVINTNSIEVQFEEMVTPSWLKKAKSRKG